MDCWASLEHQMRYKKHIPNATLIGAELLRCAEEMASTDLTMQTIREMIAVTQAKIRSKTMKFYMLKMKNPFLWRLLRF